MRFRTAILSILLLIVSTATVLAHPRVSIITESGVSEELLQDTNLAVDNTIAYISQHLQLELNHDVKVYLVKDAASYENWFMSQLKLSKEEAERRTRTTTGWSSGNLIVRNAAKNDNRTDRIFTISHEMVHQFQTQESGGKHTRLEWLAEGMADYFASQVVEESGRASTGHFAVAWLNILRKAPDRPMIFKLHTPQDWYASLDKYGTSVTYRMGGIAFRYLVDQTGNEHLVPYLRELKRSTETDAFNKIFGMELTVFEAKFQNHLSEIL